MSKELHLTKKDFRIDWFSGKGGGGQHRNKHANCCRITHLGTGMVETGQSHKQRPANQKEAFEKLARRVIAYYHVNENDYDISNERVRTYHSVRNSVKDHASGLVQTYSYVVEGQHLDDMIEARKKAQLKEQLDGTTQQE